MVTTSPRACKSFARDAEIIPFPNEDVTPPVTNIYFAIIYLFSDERSRLESSQNVITGCKVIKDSDGVKFSSINKLFFLQYVLFSK